MTRVGCCIAAIAICGCSTVLEIQTVSRPDWQSPGPRAADCPLTVYAIDQPIDPSCREIGDVFVGDTGSTHDCGWDRVVDTVRKQGCFYGAHAAQIVSHIEPSFWGSSCDQVRARFLACESEDADAN